MGNRVDGKSGEVIFFPNKRDASIDEAADFQPADFLEDVQFGSPPARSGRAPTQSDQSDLVTNGMVAARSFRVMAHDPIKSMRLADAVDGQNSLTRSPEQQVLMDDLLGDISAGEIDGFGAGYRPPLLSLARSAQPDEVSGGHGGPMIEAGYSSAAFDDNGQTVVLISNDLGFREGLFASIAGNAQAIVNEATNRGIVVDAESFERVFTLLVDGKDRKPFEDSGEALVHYEGRVLNADGRRSLPNS
ncbi:MAG: hypothetical protein WBG95_03065 [Sulfitobacter sp.]